MVNEGTMITGLALIATLTTLITEAIKKMKGDAKYNSNLIAAIVSVVTSLFICTGYVLINSVAVTPALVFACICMCLLSWLCAMLGYDKVVQMIFHKE